jgi:putative salt-induced outer membrane protein
MKKLTLLLVCALASMALGMLQAADEKKEDLWSGNLSLSMSFNDGNSNSKTQRIAFDAKRKTDYGHFTGYGEYNEGSSEGLTNKRDSKAGFKVAKDIDEDSYLFIAFETYKDQFKSLDRRNTTDLGYGYKVINNDTTKFNVESGVSYVYENYERVSSDKFMALNLSDDFKHTLESGVEIFQKGKYVPSIESSRKYTVYSEQGVRSKLTETISLDVSIKLMYDNNVPKDTLGNPIMRDNGHGVRRLDTSYFVAISKSF